MLEVAQVHGNGFGIRENRPTGQNHEQRQKYGAEWVDVVEWVERDAPARPGRGIAKGIGGQGVSALVDDDAHDDRTCRDEQRDDGIHTGLLAK